MPAMFCREFEAMATYGKKKQAAMTAMNLKLRQLMACHDGRGYGSCFE